MTTNSKIPLITFSHMINWRDSLGIPTILQNIVIIIVPIPAQYKLLDVLYEKFNKVLNI